MLTLEFYDEEKAIIRDALELYLHTLKGEPYELRPESDDERHFDEDAIRDIIMRFQ